MLAIVTANVVGQFVSNVTGTDRKTGRNLEAPRSGQPVSAHKMEPGTSGLRSKYANRLTNVQLRPFPI
jgi:hypothetical protein